MPRNSFKKPLAALSITNLALITYSSASWPEIQGGGLGDWYKLAHFCTAQATSILVKRSWLLHTFTRLRRGLGLLDSTQLDSTQLDSAWPLNLALLVCTDCIQMNSDWIHWSSSVRSDFFLSKASDEAEACGRRPAATTGPWHILQTFIFSNGKNVFCNFAHFYT